MIEAKKSSDLVNKTIEKVDKYIKIRNKKRISFNTVLNHLNKKMKKETGGSDNSIFFIDEEGQIKLGFVCKSFGYRGSINASLINGKIKFDFNPKILLNHFFKNDPVARKFLLKVVLIMDLLVRSSDNGLAFLTDKCDEISDKEAGVFLKNYQKLMEKESDILLEIEYLRAAFVLMINNELNDLGYIKVNSDLSIQYYGNDICNININKPEDKVFGINEVSNIMINDIHHYKSQQSFVFSEAPNQYELTKKMFEQIKKTPLIYDSSKKAKEKIDGYKIWDDTF